VDLTKKKEVSSFISLKVTKGWVPKFKKVGHVTLATSPLWVVHCVLLAKVDLTKKRSV